MPSSVGSRRTGCGQHTSPRYAGAVAPAGTATVVPGGYLVSGRWSYASGCQHCTWVLGGCHVFDGAQPRLAATGVPEVRVVHFPAAQVTILEDTWEVSGLVGTGSHDVFPGGC